MTPRFAAEDVFDRAYIMPDDLRIGSGGGHGDTVDLRDENNFGRKIKIPRAG